MSVDNFNAPVPAGRSVLAGVEEQRAIAETKAAIFTAQQFPRDEKKAAQLIQSDCGELKVAEKAVYTYARGGTNITGPSIRLAEAIARRWGNLNMGVRELEQRDGKSVAQAYCWDAESNIRDEKVFEVSHVIGLKNGGRKILTDPRDIYELVANMGARRKRACILTCIPAHIVEQAVEQCKRTLEQKDPLTPEKLKKMLEAFATRGVSKEMIEARFQRSATAITPAQFVILRGIWQALEDGVATIEDHFDKIEPEKPADAAKGDAVKTTLANVLEQTAPTQPAPAEPPEAPAPAEPEQPAPPVDDKNERDLLRTKIMAALPDNKKRAEAIAAVFEGKRNVPELTTAEMREFWEQHCPKGDG